MIVWLLGVVVLLRIVDGRLDCGVGRIRTIVRSGLVGVVVMRKVVWLIDGIEVGSVLDGLIWEGIRFVSVALRGIVRCIEGQGWCIVGVDEMERIVGVVMRIVVDWVVGNLSAQLFWLLLFVGGIWEEVGRN
jgi:hypothetical protein